MTKKKATNFNKYIKWFWGTIIIGVASIALIFLLVSWGAFGKLPTFEELENPKNDLATEIISSDGKTLGKFYLKANRTPVDYKDLSENLVNLSLIHI